MHGEVFVVIVRGWSAADHLPPTQNDTLMPTRQVWYGKIVYRTRTEESISCHGVVFLWWGRVGGAHPCIEAETDISRHVPNTSV